jgi:hypothetical protein
MASARDLSDEFIRCLNDRGFNPILQPTAGYLPPMIYIVDVENGRASAHGSLNRMLPPKKVLTPMSTRSSVIQDVSASKADGKLSLSLFGKLLKACGVDANAKIAAAAEASNDAKFTFGNVQSMRVERLAVEDILNEPRKNGVIGDAIRSRFKPDEFENGLVHIATEYLYSDRIITRVGAAIGGEFKLEGNAANELEAKLGLSADKNGGAATLYGGKEPVAFAFKLAQLCHEGRYYLRDGNIKGAGLSANDAGAEPYMVETGRIFEVEVSPQGPIESKD